MRDRDGGLGGAGIESSQGCAIQDILPASVCGMDVPYEWTYHAESLKRHLRGARRKEQQSKTVGRAYVSTLVLGRYL